MTWGWYLALCITIALFGFWFGYSVLGRILAAERGVKLAEILSSAKSQ